MAGKRLLKEIAEIKENGNVEDMEMFFNGLSAEDCRNLLDISTAIHAAACLRLKELEEKKLNISHVYWW